MLYRIIPALAIVTLAGCQPYYPSYSQYYGTYPYARPFNKSQTTVSGAPGTVVGGSGSTVLGRAPGVTGVSILPAAFLGGSFQEIDPHTGVVGFWNDDPVKKKEVAHYPGRYVERLTLKNGGLFVYETLNAGEIAGPSDGEQIKADLELSGYRGRGIGFDASKLAQTGPFTYLAQGSTSDSCFLFRATLRHGSSQPNARAYGNLCALRAVADVASVKAEMLYILSHVRFADSVTNDVVTAAATTAPAAITPAVATSAEGVRMSLAQCGYEVRFSGMPGLGESNGAEYAYQKGSYSERASCVCRGDLDYSKVSEFDAVDNARLHAEKKGFTLQKATFDDAPRLGRELAYEAMAGRDASETFLVGRSFFRQCGFTVEATGTSYSDMVNARKFIESVSAQAVEAAAAAAAAAPPVSAAVIGHSSANAGAPSAPVAAPRPLVGKVDLATSGDRKLPAASGTSTPGSSAATPAAAAEPASADAESAAARLRRLKTLLDDKLITPGEYDAKRKAILDNL